MAPFAGFNGGSVRMNARARWWAGAVLMFMGVPSIIGGLAVLEGDKFGRFLGALSLGVGIAAIVIGWRGMRRR